MPLTTLLDLQRLRGNDVTVGVVQENLSVAPELSILPVRSIAGTNYRILSVSGQSGGGFRSANAGVALGKPDYIQRLHECFLYEHDLELDLAAQVASAGDGIADFETLEMNQGALTVMQKIGSQIFQGTAFDSRGFTGIKQFVPKVAVSGSSSYFVDATGTTANTASSVYAVRAGIQDVHVVMGANSALNFGPWMDQQLTDTSNRKFMGRVCGLTSWVGLQIGRPQSVGRVGNLTAQSGRTLTDSLLASLLSQFPAGQPPTHIFMSRRSAFQLASSRSKSVFYTPGVANAPGQTMATIDYTVGNYMGIPIVVTDQIPDNDPIE